MDADMAKRTERQRFLLGWHLLTRIPCAHPGDIVLLRGVDDFFIAPTSAYEGLAVMRARDVLL